MLWEERVGKLTLCVHKPDNIFVPLDREKVISELRARLRETQRGLLYYRYYARC